MDKHKTMLRIGFHILFGVYLVLLAWVLFFADITDRSYAHRTYRYNLILFREIRRFLTHWDILGPVAVLGNMLGNILVFVPFGFILPLMYHRFRSLLFITLLTFECSFTVELIQLVTKVGIYDVDDMLLNTIGGIVGYLLFTIFIVIRRKWNGSNDKEKISI